jgi:Spy/CpxP family protein refolding chaperone
MTGLFQDSKTRRSKDEREGVKERRQRKKRTGTQVEVVNRRLSMTRRMTIAATILAVSLGTLPVVAHGAYGARATQGPGGGFQPGQRMGGPGRGGPGGPIVPGLNRLDLSDAQHEQLRAIMEQERQGQTPGEQLRQAEQALHAAVFADTADPQAIETAKAALNAAHAAELDHRIELMQKIAQILTPAQRQELAKMPGPGGARGRGVGHSHL